MARISEQRVLVVEDDTAVARIHCRHVSRQPGFVVVGVANSARQAEYLHSVLRPDLVLLDLGLPGGDGISLLRALRGASDPVEVIVITGHAEGATVRAAIQLGVVDYLVKPFWPARLTEALASYRNRMQLFESPRLNQESVDCARAVAPESRPAGTGLIRHRRLHQVQAAVAAKGGSVSADEIATLTGMARVTARRYLEHLVALGQCTVDQWPEGPGRPRKMYRPWLSGPVAAPPHSARD